MNPSNGDRVFSGSIAQLYEQYLVPLIFDPYAQDLTGRLTALRPSAVLEIAAGTGVVTRHMARQLPADVSIVATDLNQPMLDHAMSIGTSRPVTWQQADAMSLPFANGAFDAVVCQFGAMFFPDKSAASAEAWRVLRPGGTFLFNVWDRIEDNEFAECVTQAMAGLFPSDPPRFLARLPHGHYDQAMITDALVGGGFTGPGVFNTVTARSRADSPRTVAIAYCQGTPLRNEILARNDSILAEATDVAEAALGKHFGMGQVSGKIQAIVVTAARSA
ncbi:MAG: class I SAM-dependent methyltransferase [Casimicrobium sp.]